LVTLSCDIMEQFANLGNTFSYYYGTVC